MIEIWKDIPQYEGIYKCSNMGNIKRVVSNRCKKERILKGSSHRGYLMATLSKDDIHDRRMVHRIIASVFIENPHNKPQINHLDANKRNNCVSNLEWSTQSENIIHAHRLGNMGGVRHGMSSFTEADILTIRLKYAYGATFSYLSKEYNRRKKIMKDIVTGVMFKNVAHPIFNLRPENL